MYILQDGILINNGYHEVLPELVEGADYKYVTQQGHLIVSFGLDLFNLCTREAYPYLVNHDVKCFTCKYVLSVQYGVLHVWFGGTCMVRIPGVGNNEDVDLQNGVLRVGTRTMKLNSNKALLLSAILPRDVCLHVQSFLNF